MMRRHNLRLVGGLAIVVAAIVLLAAGLDSIELQAGTPFSWGRIEDVRRGVNPPGDFAGSAFATFFRMAVLIAALLLPFALVYVLASPERRKDLFKLVARWTVFAVLIYLLTQLAPGGGQPLSIQVCDNSQNSIPSTQAESPCAVPDTPQQVVTPQAPGFIEDPPEWAVGLVSLVLAAAILLVAWWIVRRRRAVPMEAEAEQLAAEAEEALADLRAGGDLRDAVMRCYSEMSDVIGQRRGLERRGSMTPREFEQFLTSAGLRDEHIQRLTRLFEAVRYGGRATGERDRREAIDCLSAIVHTYGRTA